MLLLLAAALASPCADRTRVDAHSARIDFIAKTMTERWIVVLDPSLCPNGLEVPTELEGARPVQGSPNTGRIEVERIRALEASTSGTLASWNAPASAVRVHFEAPSAVSLQVFADDRAHQHAAGTGLDVWWPLGAGGRPLLAWSTWEDWVEAGEALARPVRAAVPNPRELGDLGRSLARAELESLVSRLDAALAVDEPVGAGWTAGRPMSEVIASGRGTPTERGLILLAMLKGAGFDAQPAWFTPDDDSSIPRSLPAPHLLPYPAVAVRLRDRKTVWIDPGSRGARPPEVPARMRGGRVLGAGSHLVVPADTAAPRGEVRIRAEIELDGQGRMRTVARVTAHGAAEQALRGALDGKTAEQWPEIVGAWMTPRGELRDLVVNVVGLDGLEPFAIEVRYGEPQRFTPAGAALRGLVPDLFAPGLAALLPPGIAIAERLEVRPEEGLLALTAVRPDPTRTAGLMLTRSMHTAGRSLTLASDWHVLGSNVTASRMAMASKPSEIFVFPEGDGKARKAVDELGLADPDARVVDAMLLWRLGNGKKATRALARLHPGMPVPEIAALLGRYVPPGDREPWEALVGLVKTDAERIAVIDGLVAVGDQRLGWQLATGLTRSADAETRTRAFVQVARLQGPQPEASTDPEGHKAWREPVKLLEAAIKRSEGRDDLARVDLANAYLRAGTPMAADALLEAAMDAPDPWAMAVYAEFGGVTGVYGIDVLGLVDRALSAAPDDPAVRESCGRALAAIGRRREGVGQVLRAAELAGNDGARWMAAADMAIEHGDLGAAVYAARRASDLNPRNIPAAVQLQKYAVLAADPEQADLGRERAGADLFDGVGASLEDLIAFAPEHELALLRHHAEEVEANRALLRKRADLHTSRHMIEDAALDGSLLLSRHRDGNGARYVAAGLTSRVRHTNPTKLVARYTGDDDAREARMDIQLVIGEDPIANGARGKVLAQLKSRPEAVAEAAPTWPLAMKDFEAAPPAGFKENKTLGAVKGVVAWSDRDRQISVLRTEKSTGDLPPPLAVLYQTGPTVLATARGAAVVRLDGGAVPVYAGVTIHDGQDVVGLGLTPGAARDAVLYGIGELTPPEPLGGTAGPGPR